MSILIYNFNILKLKYANYIIPQKAIRSPLMATKKRKESKYNSFRFFNIYYLFNWYIHTKFIYSIL